MSGFVPGFESDLFLSYAHGDGAAWIRAFEKSLSESLLENHGLKVTLWQDVQRLRSGQHWQAEIEHGVQRSALFVAVLSPSYENSDWCARERGFFRQLFVDQAAFEGSNRFIKVLKTPWPNGGHEYFLPAIQYRKGDFFRRREGSDDDVEHLPGSRAFKQAIDHLAKDLAQALHRLRSERERVFVGSPAEDCLDVWNQVRDELYDRGYDVRPLGRRTLDFADVRTREEMERALLSVHLLSAGYDPFVERQIRLAADLEQRLLFWLAPGAAATADTRQAALLETLRNGLRPGGSGLLLPPGSDLLPPLSPRSLIAEILAALKPPPAAPELAPPLAAAEPAPAPAAPEPAPARAGTARLYIVHDATTEEDSQIAADLGQQIEKREGFDVFLSRVDLSSALELRQRHEALLQTCEGVLLCRKAAPRSWLMQVAPEVSLAERLFQRPPLKSRAFLLSEPSLLAGLPNFRPIPYSPDFRLGDLEPFLAPLRSPAQGVAHGA